MLHSYFFREASGGRLKEVNENIRIDGLYGFHRVTDIQERTGFLINMHPVSCHIIIVIYYNHFVILFIKLYYFLLQTEIIEDDKRLFSGVDYYFLEEDCTRFKISYPYCPYFYILCRKDTYEETSTGLKKKYSGLIQKVETLYKEDLDLV